MNARTLLHPIGVAMALLAAAGALVSADWQARTRTTKLRPERWSTSIHNACMWSVPAGPTAVLFESGIAASSALGRDSVVAHRRPAREGRRRAGLPHASDGRRAGCSAECRPDLRATAARTLERLVGEVRKLPPEVSPLVQMHWCQPKCFRALTVHLAVLEETAAAAARVTSLSDIPLVIISSGDQPADVIAAHRRLARLSSIGRHVTAAECGHWIQFDAPTLVIDMIPEIVDSARRPHAA